MVRSLPTCPKLAPTIVYKDENKVPLTNLDPAFIEALSARQAIGDEKHRNSHWTQGVSVTKILGGIKRHVSAIEQGEYFDRDDAGQHAVAAACGLMYIFYYVRFDERYQQFFDQQFKEFNSIGDELGGRSDPGSSPADGADQTPA